MRVQSAFETVVLDDDLVVEGENEPVLRTLPDGHFDLIYMDPPFNTGRRQLRRTTEVSADPSAARVGFGGRRYRSRLLQSLSYDDEFADYLGFLEPRLTRARELLAPHGTLYFHIDYREAHYCKLLLDEVFGRDAFLNELIWAYDYGAKPRRRWPAKHDTILVYVRTPGAHHFDADAVEREPYMAPGLVGPEKAARGKRPTDVWFHTIVPTNGREKTGYPTQKPEGVLRRMVAASSRQDIVIAGGVESMSNVPITLSVALPAQNGYGNYKSPRMEERYPGIEFSQFSGAEAMARKYDLSRAELDAYTYASHRKAREATEAGWFVDEIVPVDVELSDGTRGTHTVDEGIRFDASLEAIGAVKLLQPGGRVTAASSSQICDGASACMVVNERGLAALGVKPLARIHHASVLGHDPVIMLEAPIPATERALRKAGLTIDEIDLFEVNEAFAPVPLAWLRATGADPAKLNVHGGAIALGHPLGSSGTKLMTTLLHALERRGGRYGLQTMCEGGGLANVTIVERLPGF